MNTLSHDRLSEIILSYLRKVAEEEDHGKDIENVAYILSSLADSSTPSVQEGASSSELATTTPKTPETWKRYERAAAFLASLQAAGPPVEVDQEQLERASRILLQPLEDRAHQRQKYTYSPLEKGSNFRLLRLNSYHGERLCCSIEHVRIEGAQYEALSYEWGNPDPYFWIDVEDSNTKFQGSIALTANLYNTLCDIRDRTENSRPTLWIDQICINQHENSEKQHQVNLMKEIYQNASRVVSYLGPSMPSDDAAFDLLQYILDLYHDIDLDSHEQVAATKDMCRSSDLYSARFERNFPQKIDQAMWRMLFGPWTRRLWMVQEVCYVRTKLVTHTKWYRPA